MSVALLDVDVLLALGWPNHQHHRAAHDWFGREAGGGWATCALTQLGFIRLSSNPAYTPAPVSPGAAAALLRQWTEHTAHAYWDAMVPPVALVFTAAFGHAQVTDAYLVHLAESCGGRLVTFDRRVATHARMNDSVQVL